MIPDGHLDQRHEEVPTVIAFDLVEQLLEPFVGLEELAGVEAADGGAEAGREPRLRHPTPS